MSTSPVSSPRHIPVDRTAINRANSQHSTGPRTDAGKQRSSLNALRHGLTAASAVLPSEDPAAYDATSPQLLRRIPTRHSHRNPARPASSPTPPGASTASRSSKPTCSPAPPTRPTSKPPSTFDIVDAHRLIANLGIQGQRLSRQFQKSLDKLRDIQADRAERERRDLKDAAAILELHKHKGIPWEPADHGFVFSKDQVQRFAQRNMRLHEARHIDYLSFPAYPTLR